METDDLYARYDGPLPRSRGKDNPACRIIILCNCLQAIRLRRRNGDFDCLATLGDFAKALRKKIVT